MFKKLGLIIGAALLLSACGAKKPASQTSKQTRQLINALPVSARPLLVVFPHSTSKLLTIYLDRVAGNIKHKLDDGTDVINVLRSDFTFITRGEVTTTDGRVTYAPNNAKQKDQILLDTQGLPQAVACELAYAPIAISAVSNAK